VSMRLPAGTRAAAALALLLICSTAASAQTPGGIVRGEVLDASGGVLPGVTVVANSANGRVLATTVTDGVGRYVLGGLPVGRLTLLFQLEGFDPSRVEITVQSGVESRVVQRLGLAQVTEQVVVFGTAPAAPPAPRPPPVPEVPYRPPPAPVVIPVPIEEMESICRPAKPPLMPAFLGTIQSHRYDTGRALYGKGDELTIDGGRLLGLEVGLNLVVRRNYRASGAIGDFATGEHTAGLVQIVATSDRSSTAVVMHTCNELMKGDFLAAFIPEPMRAPEAAGVPAFEDGIRILFADAGQMLGVAGRRMVIDRGSAQGIRAGQRLTLFRREERSAGKPVVIGDAIVISVSSDSATIRVERATDPIEFGDWAAPQRPSP
jgi:hypothetical protein